MHLGIVSPPVSGHINPFAALGRELKRRSHRVTWFHMEDLAGRILYNLTWVDEAEYSQLGGRAV